MALKKIHCTDYWPRHDITDYFLMFFCFYYFQADAHLGSSCLEVKTKIIMDAQIQGLLILLVMGVWHYFSSMEVQVAVGGALFSADSGNLRLKRNVKKSTQEVLSGTLGWEFDLKGLEHQRCEDKGLDSVCLEWPNHAKVTLEYVPGDTVDCYEVEWESFTRDSDPHDCFELGPDHWYGGGHLFDDRWTIEKRPVEMTQYVSADTGYNNFEFQDSYGSVLERYWVSSSGIAIYVEDKVPLHVGIDRSNLCLKASYDNSYFKRSFGTNPMLKYKICIGRNVRQIHEYMANQHWKKPVGVPDETMMRHPIWSTWAKYKMNINETKVLEFAYEINNYGFKGSQIEIDDMYTPKYGDFIFDSFKFPNPSNMTTALHGLGFRVTSWVIPFANVDSDAFQEGAKMNYFVRDKTGKVPGLTHWWQGVGALLDPTNPDAVKWFDHHLQALKEAGVDSFKFDAGETNFLPPGFKTHRPLLHANHFSRVYAEMAANLSDRMMEVRVGYKSQHLPVMVRVMDKESRWGYNRGLRSLIPSCLLFGLLGYPFVLPDMIGGNSYSDNGEVEGGELPSKELYIRWLQLTAFLPAMQFSITPWQFDEETVRIAHRFVRLHAEYVTPRVLTAARESTISGAPIVRPLWWHDPEDPATFPIDSQFMIGKDLMVSPILHHDMTKRDIYIPKGRWKDVLLDNQITGPIVLRDYQININETAYFELIA